MKQSSIGKCQICSMILVRILFSSISAYAANVSLAWNPNSEPDLAGYKVYYGTVSGIYTDQIVLGTETTYSLSISMPGTYFFAVTAYNKIGQESGFSNEVSATIPDLLAPIVMIMVPTSSGRYSTGSGTLTVMGSAADNVGVTEVTWANDRGGSGTASGTTTWSVMGITLQQGSNVLTVTARDAAWNMGKAVLNVTRNNLNGLVANTNGTPIPGATITLYRSDSMLGPFGMVLPGSGILSPPDNANPVSTAASGYFGWNVIPGYYKIRAEKSGCVSAENRGNLVVETGALGIPPPQNNLRLVFYCGELLPLFLPIIK